MHGSLLVALAGFAAGAPATAQSQDAPSQTIRAVRTDRPPTIDAVLDEPFWQRIEPITDFRQRVPVDGAPASERTELRVAFDDNNLYFAIVLHDSDPGGIRRSILHREGRIDQDDNIRIGLDTYNDKRNAYIFEINPFGTQGDALITDESMTLSDWNWEGVYESEGRVTEDGWVVEAAIPFTTIRFADADAPEMGILLERTIRRKNEMVYFPHIGQEFRQGLTQVSQYATLTGLEGLRRGRYMEAKPFAIAGRSAAGRRGDLDPETETLNEIGLDFKYSITSNLTLDATVNPDFAQVEADNVQINLTRFSLFFPEKREFFLERAGLFDFGDAEETVVFFSRRIGIGNDIAGGARLTGQAGPLSDRCAQLVDRGPTGRPGALRGPRRSQLGAAAARRPVPEDYRGRDPDVDGRGRRVQPGAGRRLPGAFRRVQFGAGVARALVGRWGGLRCAQPEAAGANADVDAGSAHRRRHPGRPAEQRAGGRSRVPADPSRLRSRPGLRAARRHAALHGLGRGASALRTERLGAAARLHAERRLHRRESMAPGRALRSSSAIFSASRPATAPRLRSCAGASGWHGPRTSRGAGLEAREYGFTGTEIRFNTNDSREFSARGGIAAGEFWGGTRTQLSGGLMWKTGPHLTISGDYSWNDVSLPADDGDFTTRLVGVTVLGALSRALFANALIQYDDVSNVVQANVRINWIHTPGSDLFVVFDTGYLTGDLLDPRTERWQRRTGVVKLTYLKAF